MQLMNTLFISAILITATVAQTPTSTSLHFTSIPTALVAGVKQTIGWAGGNGNGVNIILQQGPADNLQDVPITPIATGQEGNSTTWTPPKSLPDAGNYALRIEQGEDSVNYSGMLQLFQGCSTCPTNAVAALASTSTSSTGSATASPPSSTASSGSNSGVVTPVVAPGSKSSNNSTGAAGSSGNSTITGARLNSTTGTGGMANTTVFGTNSTTNSAINSTTNSTMSSATLHATSSPSSSTSSSTSSSSKSSSSSESTSSSTGSSASPSATKKSSGVTVAASNFALVLCAIVGVVYLG
ncbi:MAG: hypothetical protein Q9175_002816 [Cornicularia normoerica]